MTQMTKDDKNTAVVNTEEFTADGIKVQVETKHECQVVMEVELGNTHYAQARKVAIKQVQKKVSMPGFRKGKVPQNIIEKNYDPSIKNATQQELADIGFKEAQKLAKLPIFHNNQQIVFNALSVTPEASKLQFKFERDPVIPTIDYSKIKVDLEPAQEIGDKEVDETLKQIQLFFATWDKVDDRPVQEGDYLLLDIDDLEGEKPERVFNRAKFEVNKDSMAVWLHELLIGMKLGETKEGVSSADDKASDEEKENFKPKKVSVTVAEIQQPTLPEIDDELAKKMGVESADKMRENLKGLRQKQADKEANATNRSRFVDALFETHDFEVPHSTMRSEVAHRMDMVKRRAGAEWSKKSAEEQEEAHEKVENEAKVAIKLFFLCRQVSGENKLKLDAARINPQPGSTLEMMFADQNQVNFDQLTDEQKSMEMTRHMLEQAQDFMLEQFAKGQK
ncbi:MAG: Trigger factor [Chlamydiia bacterium]|nr:Trigger factor [Chlamydiia bacterium]